MTFVLCLNQFCTLAGDKVFASAVMSSGICPAFEFGSFDGSRFELCGSWDVDASNHCSAAPELGHTTTFGWFGCFRRHSALAFLARICVRDIRDIIDTIDISGVIGVIGVIGVMLGIGVGNIIGAMIMVVVWVVFGGFGELGRSHPDLRSQIGFGRDIKQFYLCLHCTGTVESIHALLKGTPARNDND